MSDKNSFTSHFIELRSRLIKSIIFILVIFIVAYTFAEHIYSFLVNPYAEAVKDDLTSRRLIFTALHETFITYLKVAFFAAIFGSQFYSFKFISLLPQVYTIMKKTLLPYLISTPILFFWWYACILSSDATSYKVFLSFETMGSSTSFQFNLRQK